MVQQKIKYVDSVCLPGFRIGPQLLTLTCCNKERQLAWILAVYLADISVGFVILIWNLSNMCICKCPAGFIFFVVVYLVYLTSTVFFMNN